MSSTIPRRSFLAILAAIPLLRLKAGTAAQTIYTPSFLHPNQHWVVLRSDKLFGLEILDLDTGKLIKRIEWDRWETYYGWHSFHFDPSGRFLVMLFKGYDCLGLVRWDLSREGRPLAFSIKRAQSGDRAGCAIDDSDFYSETFPGFLLPAPGGILRIPDSDWNLVDFTLKRRRATPMAATGFTFSSAGGTRAICAEGNVWELLKDPEALWAVVRSRIKTSLRLRVSRLPMIWQYGEGFRGMDVRVTSRMDSGSLLVWSGYSTVREYGPATGKLIRCVSGTMPQTGLLSFGPNRHVVFAARPLGTAVKWKRNGQQGPPQSEFSGGPKPPITEQGLKCAEESNSGFTAGVRVLAYRDGRLGLGLDDGRVLLGLSKDAHGGPWKTLGRHDDVVRGMAFSPEDPWLLTGARDGSLTLWDIHDGRPIRELVAHDARVNAVAITKARIAATVGPDGMRIWNLESGQLRQIIETGGIWVSDVCFNPDGSRVAAALLDGSIRVWEVEGGALCWKKDAEAGWCAAVAFHPDGWTIAAGYELGSLVLWDGANGEVQEKVAAEAKTEWQSGRYPIHSLCWSADGTALAVALGDAVRVYDRKLRSSIGPAWVLPLDWADEYT